ncbi:DUF2079 domain-containing protein, partial [bacterium]|nr:DUF2079 domain-containing protein [bacterium]
MGERTRPGTIFACLLALELGLFAGGMAELLSCEVALSELVCVPGAHSSGELLVPLGLLAVSVLGVAIFREKSGKPTLEPAARALLPLLAFCTPLLRARALAGPPHVLEAILAPIAVGAAVARVTATARPRSKRWRRGLALPVAGAAFVVAIGFAWHALGLLEGLALGHHDAGDHAVRLENTLRGSFLKCDPGHAAFWDHLNPGVALLAPFYAVLRPIFPGTRFTTVAQAVVLAGTALLAYGLARRRLADRASALLLSLAFLATPAFTHLNVAYSYGFHTVTLTMPMLFGAAWAYLAGRRLLALALVLLSWACEETLAPATFGMGLALALDRRARAHGAILALASLGYFLLATKVLLPLANGSGYFCTSYYAHLSPSGKDPATITNILVSPIVRPAAFWGTLLEPATFGLVLG